MEYIKAITSENYFTAGSVYPIIDGSISTGVYTVDDEGKNHYLSTEYINNNFVVA